MGGFVGFTGSTGCGDANGDPIPCPPGSGPNPSAPSSGGGAGGAGTDWLSGLSDIFSSVGSAIGTTYRNVNTPTVLLPGQIPYATATGYNTSAAGLASITGLLSNPIILIGGGFLLYLLIRKK